MTTFNTGNPVPSTDGRDLSDNAETIDAIVNGATQTTASRTGKGLSTIKNLENQYVFTAINNGVWASGQTFTAVNQFMVFSGTAYKPKNSTTLPYVVGATPVGDANVEVVGNLSTAQGDARYSRFTTVEVTWYVDPAGSDSNDGSIGSPFQSIQKAVDVIPTNIHHRQTIQLVDGTHVAGSRSTNPIPGASTVRVVRVLIDNKNIHGREMLVIQGNVTNKALTIINHDDVFSSVYVEETNGVVVKDVTINCALNVGAAQSIFQHRRGDMRISDVTFTGNDFDGSHAIITETGGFIELAGDIIMTNYERGIVALEGVISFIGAVLTHDGGTATAPRTFEAGNGGRIDMFSGALTVTNVQRLVFAKDSAVLVSPASSTVTATGFILDADATATIEARRIVATGGARAVDNKGGHVLINLCTFTDQTTSAIVGIDGSVTIVDDCSLIDTTVTKSLIDVESSTLIVKGDGDIDRGFRGIFAKNSIVQIDNQMNFLGNAICIDARQSDLRLEGTSGNPITFGTYTTNALNLEGTNCSMTHLTITNPASKTAVLATASQINNDGGVDIDGGFRGFDLDQNSSLSAETTTGSDLTNMTEGANIRRGSQMFYRTSSMDFTGTGTPTVEDTAKSAHVTAF